MEENNNMYTSIKDVEIYFEIYGEGTPILMLHGFSPDMELMKGCMEPFFQKSGAAYKRIYIDLPGMGKSKQFAHLNNTDDMLDIVTGFIEKEIQNEAFLIAGESYGGYLARGVIARESFSVLGAFFICPVIYAARDKRTLPVKQTAAKDELFLQTLGSDIKAAFEDNCVVLNELTYNRWTKEIVSGMNRADQPFLEKISGNYSFGSWFKEPKFDQPSVFLLGRQDDVVGFEDAFHLKDNFHQGSYAILDGAGHNLQIERPILFDAYLEDWLKRIHDRKLR